MWRQIIDHASKIQERFFKHGWKFYLIYCLYFQLAIEFFLLHFTRISFCCRLFIIVCRFIVWSLSLFVYSTVLIRNKVFCKYIEHHITFDTTGTYSANLCPNEHVVSKIFRVEDKVFNFSINPFVNTVRELTELTSVFNISSLFVMNLHKSLACAAAILSRSVGLIRPPLLISSMNCCPLFFSSSFVPSKFISTVIWFSENNTWQLVHFVFLINRRAI